MRRWNSKQLILALLFASLALAVETRGATFRPAPLRTRVAQDLMAQGDARLARGEIAAAIELYERARQVASGELSADLVALQYSLECGQSGGSFTPKVADFPGGAWQGYGLGADETEALQNLLSAGFTAVEGYRKTCKKECPDGSVPPEEQCVSIVTSSKPTSVDPADYGSRKWTVTKQPDGRIRIGPVTVTKLPANITATPSCTACTKCAGAGDGVGAVPSSPGGRR